MEAWLQDLLDRQATFDPPKLADYEIPVKLRCEARCRCDRCARSRTHYVLTYELHRQAARIREDRIEQFTEALATWKRRTA